MVKIDVFWGTACLLCCTLGFMAGCKVNQPMNTRLDTLETVQGADVPELTYEQLYMDQRPLGVYLVHLKFPTARKIEWEAVFDDGEILARAPTGTADDWVLWLAESKQWSFRPAATPPWLDALRVK